MPYSESGNDVPDYVPKEKKKQWAAVWNSSYKEHGSEERAFADANAVAGPNSSKILKTDLFIDEGEYDEPSESKIRTNLELWADYAESGPTFDPKGDYLCGSCAMRFAEKLCTHVVSPISFDTGSCRIYEIDESSGIPLRQKLTQIEVAYTERPTVKGFGCKRCEFGDKAKHADAAGRQLWCSFWGCHVTENACCFKNTGDDDVFAPVRGNHDKTEKSGGKNMPTQANAAFDEPLIFCRLVKVDEAKREVWGVVTSEEPDRDGEICDFDTTVPFYQAVVDEMKKASEVNPDGGMNIFPLRAMHGLVAAGKGIAIEFRKDAKEIYMGFKVVDDNEWKKVQENVYTGFSQGGRYVKRWKDGDYTRYTAKPGEVSLVDIPCLEQAHFDQVKALKMLGANNGGYDYVKADGSIEFKKFALPVKKEAPIPSEAGAIPTSPTPVVDASTAGAACPCTCSNCKNGSCSTCTASDKCACAGKANKTKKLTPKQIIKQAQEAQKSLTVKHDAYTKMVKSILEDRINFRAFGYLGKGMYNVQEFAQVVDHLGWLLMSIEIEEEFEGEETEKESETIQEIKTILGNLLDALLAYTESQVEEAKEYLSA